MFPLIARTIVSFIVTLAVGELECQWDDNMDVGGVPPKMLMEGMRKRWEMGDGRWEEMMLSGGGSDQIGNIERKKRRHTTWQ